MPSEPVSQLRVYHEYPHLLDTTQKGTSTTPDERTSLTTHDTPDNQDGNQAPLFSHTPPTPYNNTVQFDAPECRAPTLPSELRHFHSFFFAGLQFQDPIPIL